MAKSYCKGVDITDYFFIYSAVCACLRKITKRRRPDTIRLFASILNTSKTNARNILKERSLDYYTAISRITNILRDEIINESLDLPPIHIKYKLDGTGGKIRKISVQHIKQLLFDHIAVFGLRDLTKLLGQHQVSGRKGMGGSYGTKIVNRWMKVKRRKYSCKLDIHHYYESVDVDLLMDFLKNRVRNKKLIWLVNTLLRTGEKGLNIGSYLSHFLANLYLSPIWRYIMQEFKGEIHALFYMDDLCLVSSNKRILKKAISYIRTTITSKYKLTIKPNSGAIHLIDKSRPLDLMGIRFNGDGSLSLRKRIFRRARRAMKRCNKHTDVRKARRIISYNGWIRRAKLWWMVNSREWKCVLKSAKLSIRYEQKRINSREAA